MDIKWYIVYTKPHLEKKVSETLTRKKIENYSPVINATRHTNNNRKIKDTPLFKGFVFVKTTEQQHQELKKIKGVLNLVYWMGKPVTVKSHEIKAIRLFLNEYTNVAIEKTAIVSGDLNMAENNHEQGVPMITIKNKKAYVGLPSLGYIMSAEVEKSNVRIISAENILSVENALDSETTRPNKLFHRVAEINNSLKSYWVKVFIISIWRFIS